jgi:hypothetical protein
VRKTEIRPAPDFGRAKIPEGVRFAAASLRTLIVVLVRKTGDPQAA